MSENKQPLVSIVTPAYNAEAFIDGTFQSILAQDYKNWQWLVVMDKNSSDSTLNRVRQFASHDPRVLCIESEKSGGTANNRALALSMAQGKYVAFLDADDQWAPEKLSRQISFMEKNNILFSYTGYQWMNEHGQMLGKHVVAPETITYKDLLTHRASIGCLTVVIQRESFKNETYEDIGAEDFTFWLKLLRKIPQADGLPDNLAKYRIVQGSRSRNKFRWALHRWDSLRRSEKISLLPAAYYFSLYALRSLRAYL